jgi:hypothetical protein
VPAFAALVIAMLAAIFPYDFCHIQYGLAAASLVCFLFSRREYAVLEDGALTIFYEAPTAGITIGYDQIESIQSERKTIVGIFRLGGSLGDVPNCSKEVEYVRINLKTPLDMQSLQSYTGKREVSIEDEKIRIDEKGSWIILYKPPDGGFRPFLDALSKPVRVLNADMFRYEEKTDRFMLEMVDLFFLFVMLIVTLFIFSHLN